MTRVVGTPLSGAELAQRQAIPRGVCLPGCDCRKHQECRSSEGKERHRRRVLGNQYAAGNHSTLGRRMPHKDGCQCCFHRDQGSECNCYWKGGPGFEWSGQGWKAARRAVWARDIVCRVCGGPPRKRRLDVHHVVARRDGGTNDLGNLVGVHQGRCHKLAEASKVEFA